MQRRIVCFAAFCCLVSTTFAGPLDLSGTWRLQLDREGVGEQERWFEERLSEEIGLPGSLQEQGFGDDVTLDTPWTGFTGRSGWAKDERYAPYRQPGNIKVPFWLQPEKYFKGAAWFQRDVEIPAEWQDKRIVLVLERPHWETVVWVDGRKVGMRNSLSAPHEYDLTSDLSPGRHTLTIRVDNTLKINVGINSHSVTDHTQSNWNGIVGELKLIATDQVWLDDVRVYPDVAGKRAKVRVRIGNAAGGEVSCRVTISAQSPGGNRTSTTHVSHVSRASHGTIECLLPLGDDVQPWDEFAPDLYKLDVSLETDVLMSDTRRITFGMRNITTQGTQFVLNGRPIFLRGTLECCIFPMTGYPPTGVEYWRKLVRVCKAHGLNHIRFHSWCPPEAAFVVADEMGFYYQVECASWANSGASVGDGKPLDKWLYEEAERIVRAYGNHPSFLFMAYGNEPAGPERGAKYLREWCTYWREREPRCLHTSGAGWPLIAESDFHNSPDPRIQGWGQGLRSIINAKPPQTQFDFSGFVASRPDKPTVSHEIGQWCVYPNLDETRKYRGVLKAKNFEVFRDLLGKAHMGDQARDFLMASGKLQALCYRADIEAALRTRGFGGFQLLDLHDFPGQGTALVGILDPFWDEKGYVSSKEHRRYCGPCVPLARMAKRVWENNETFVADVDVSYFGPEDLPESWLAWRLETADGRPVASGEFPRRALPTGKLTNVGRISVPLNGLSTAAKLVLTATVVNAGAENSWDVWVYPQAATIETPAGVHVASALDAEAVEVLRGGGDVLLLVLPGRVKTDVKLGFSSIFWNTAWTGGQAPHTLGILCDPRHPALAAFPSEYHSNWQWWGLVSRAATMEMDALPLDVHPIVQVVPDWFCPKRLGLVFEAEVAGGKLLVCSMDLSSDLERRPVARQMLASLTQYMRGGAFRPKHALTVEQVQRLFKMPSRLHVLGATAHASSEEVGYEAALAIDGDPKTLWHTKWTGSIPGYPHHIAMELKADVVLKGVRLLGRGDGNPNGSVGRVAVHVCDDGVSWGDAVVTAQLGAGNRWQTVSFPRAVQARHVQVRTLTPKNAKHPWACFAEVDILE